ncbi:hypothetical protein [Alicyclobacillus sp. ALC3]|uniref:hypothetical protein n=1 Tax=Alicyclobacillus sp. ALC3 TaxID=2796143 RepID=UPI002379A3EA|nr:hypothetical protein [Alicyclobacillus sp. ALC3]WDL95518.1 hypothetical protein JC200_14085 [Alicyclobacillus sp. ALC3]
MNGYFSAVAGEFRKNGWNAFIVVVFTIARLFFGWDWFKAGWDKLTVEHWLSDGKFNAGGLLKGMVASIQHSHGMDPLHFDNLLVWAVNHIFVPMGGFLDFLVVFFEIFIGLFVFFGFGFIWSMLAALFLNLQYATAGASNNFGYLVTDIVWVTLPKYASLIGFDGYIRYRRGKQLLDFGGLGSRKNLEDGAVGANFKSGGRGTPAKM